MEMKLSLDVDKKIIDNIINEKAYGRLGHLGTHIDIMDKSFPLEYLKRKAIVFKLKDYKEIVLKDIDINRIEEDSIILFYTGQLDKYGYGTKEYNKDHPILSYELIDYLIFKKISLIGIDFPGLRRGLEHTPIDAYLSDNGIFVIENMVNIDKLPLECVVNIKPIKHGGSSGLPCVVIAEV